ncbi:MAG: hypothetical protein KKH40_06065 [Nanoarchaeota archaeon]|nr:hypothetical protein [Nanoarchaeota archaeon]
MNGLEQKVREQIALEFKNRAAEHYTQEKAQESKKYVIAILNDALTNVTQIGILNKSECSLIKETSQEALTRGLEQETVLHMIYNNWMMSAKEYKQICIKSIKQASKTGEQAPAGILKFFKTQYDVAKKEDEIVFHVLKKAKKNGLKKIITTQDIYESVRNTYPTSEYYMNAKKKQISSSAHLAQIISGEQTNKTSVVWSIIFPHLSEKTTEIMENIFQADVNVIYSK